MNRTSSSQCPPCIFDEKSGANGPQGSPPVAPKYPSEMSLEDGLMMVEEIDSLVNKLQLEGGLRKETWLKEVKG